MKHLYFKMSRLPVALCTAMLLLALPGNTRAAFPTRVIFQQAVTVSGKIIDDTGEALPGVNIIEKGTNNGVVSDANGAFRITVGSPSSVLVLSFVGYATQQVVVGNQTSLTLTMISDAATLSEVVVVGYGTQEKRDVTGAMSSVKADDFNKGIINTPEQLLQGKVAGVNVTSASGEPGAAQAITVRGPGSIRSGSTPLFVVDGLPLDNSSTGVPTNPLNFINPQDIESIDVLKDASATAIYGARGANGVVIITTKKGKSGKSSLSYSANYGISKMARALPVLTADEYRRYVPELGGVLIDSLHNTNWQKEITQTAITQNHNLNLSGGAEKFTYYASLGVQNQDGVVKKSNLKRYSGRLNINQKLLNDRLSVDLNLNATNTTNTRPPLNELLGNALAINPTFRPYDKNGKLINYQIVANPLLRLNLFDDITTNTRIIGNLSPSFQVLKGLVYRLNVGIDHSNTTRDIQYWPSIDPPQDGRLETYYTLNNNNLVENFLTYDFKVSDHNVNLLLGHSYQKIFVQTRGYSINKFLPNGLEPRYAIEDGQDLTLANNKPSGSATKNELQSFFGRAQYTWKDRYLLTATLRADGSSKFGANNKYGIFPSFSAGWRLSDEAFFTGLPFTNLKLRAGWGQTGNQEIPSKVTQALFSTGVSSGSSYPLENGAYPAGTTYRRLANPNLQWEVSTQTNIGLDFGILNGALSGTIDYFNKVSSNIVLLVIPADPAQPALDYYANIKGMKIVNQGLELGLNYQYSKGDFSFSVGGNATFIHNEVKNSPYSLIGTGNATGAGLSSTNLNGYINGEPIGTFFVKEFIGFDENGQPAYLDVDKNGEVNEKDRVVAGTALPDKLYNFSATFGYKNFDLSFNLNGVAGNKVYDNTANALFTKQNLSRGLNTIGEVLSYTEESANSSAIVSSRFLKNGAFLRLNNASLGYNVNVQKLGISNWVNKVRLSVTGQNLFVITQYDGYDPEVNTDRSIDNVTSYGIDYLSYPKARTILFGLNVSF